MSENQENKNMPDADGFVTSLDYCYFIHTAGLSQIIIYAPEGQKIGVPFVNKLRASPELFEALTWAVSNPDDSAYWLRKAELALAKANGNDIREGEQS